jgi:hypothetical protein
LLPTATSYLSFYVHPHFLDTSYLNTTVPIVFASQTNNTLNYSTSERFVDPKRRIEIKKSFTEHHISVQPNLYIDTDWSLSLRLRETSVTIFGLISFFKGKDTTCENYLTISSFQTLYFDLHIPHICTVFRERTATHHTTLDSHPNPLMEPLVHPPNNRRLKRRWTFDEIH